MRARGLPACGAMAMYLIPMSNFCIRNLPSGACAIARAPVCCLAIPASQLAAQADKALCRQAGQQRRQAGGRQSRQRRQDRAAALAPEAHTQQSIQLDGKTLKYTVTVGALPVRDKDGKIAGEVVVTAYTVEGENRPVTFALNGGPGASSRVFEFWRHRAEASAGGQ